MKKFLITVLTPMILMVFVPNCSKNADNNLQNNQIVIGITNEPENLNPLFPLSNISYDVNSLIFNNLMCMDEDLVNFSPELAKRWYISKDSMDITFILQDNVFWHDGEKLTADDVKFTFEMQTDRRVAWDGISYKQNIQSVNAVNDSTVVFHFNKKTPFMLMDANEGEILPQHILSMYDPEKLFQSEFSHHPIGTGPYKLSAWENQQYLILEKHPQYFKPSKPFISKVIFKIVNDKSILLQQLFNNEVDIIYNLSPGEMHRIEKNSAKVNISEYPGKDYDFIGWNLIEKSSFDSLSDQIAENPQKIIPDIKPHPLFGDPEVRRALSMCVDREKICEVLFHNVAEPITKPFIMFGDFDDNTINARYDYNIKEAQKILANQGWSDNDNNGILDKNGIEFSFTMYTNSGNLMREQLILVLEQEYKKLKIKMTPKIVEGNYLVSEIISTKNFDAILLGWMNAIKPDFTMLFHSSQYLHPFQLSGYYSPEFDRLCEQNLVADNKKDYYQSLHEIVNLLQNDAPYTWLYYKKNNVAYNRRIHNFQPSVVKKFKYLEDYKIE